MPLLRKIYTAVFAFVSLALAGFSAEEPKILFIPLHSVEQTVSEKMRQQPSEIETEDMLSRLPFWPTMAELPAWVFVKKKREIAYVFGRDDVNDDYRYAVILGKKKELIIVRADGIGGTYEIFLKPKQPDRPSWRQRSARPLSEEERSVSLLSTQILVTPADMSAAVRSRHRLRVQEEQLNQT